MSEEKEMIMQAIRELSEKIDSNHEAAAKRLEGIEVKLDYIKHKVSEHDEQIYTLNKKV